MKNEPMPYWDDEPPKPNFLAYLAAAISVTITLLIWIPVLFKLFKNEP